MRTDRSHDSICSVLRGGSTIIVIVNPPKGRKPEVGGSAVVALSWSRQMKCTSYLMLCKAIWEVKWSSCKCFNDTNILTVVRTYLCGTLIIIQPCLCQPPHLRLGKLLFCKTFKLQGKDFTHFENNTYLGKK